MLIFEREKKSLRCTSIHQEASSMEEIEERHERELVELRERVKEMIKKAKKSEKAIAEAQAIQMEFDLKAKQREEIEEYETQHGIKESK
jgi:hypothetical protein